MTAGFADEPLVDAEPVPDTGAFAEPESMAERRDHLTEVRQAVEAERERCAAIARESVQRQLDPFIAAVAQLLRALASQPGLTDGVMDAADEIRKAVAGITGNDIGPAPGRTSP